MKRNENIKTRIDDMELVNFMKEQTDVNFMKLGWTPPINLNLYG